MASVDDVFIELKDLSAKMWRGYAPTVGGAIGPGMVPDTRRKVTELSARVAGIETQVGESHNLLNAVNEQTLSRIETEIRASRDLLNAVNDQTLRRIETQLNDVLQFLPTVRADMMDLQARFDGLNGDIEKEMTDLHAKLDGLKLDIQALPQSP